MTDRLFYPLALVVAALLVLLALEPWADRPPSGPVSGGSGTADDVTVAGEDLYRLRTGPSGELTVNGGESDQAVTARLMRAPGDDYAEPQSGPFLTLAEDVEFALQSRPIEVTIEARSTGDFAAEAFEANYVARPGLESDWQRFNLTHEFAPYTFTWTTPPAGAELGYDHLGIRPVATDSRATMEIRSIRIRAIGPKQQPPA